MDAHSKIPRRQFLAGMMCSGLLPATAFSGEGDVQPPALKTIAQRKGLFWGTGIQRREIESAPDLATLVERQCSVIVPEWEMKWGAVERRRGGRDFRQSDAIVTFAKRSNLKMRGHTLVWHRNMPDWAKAALKEKSGWDLVASYITAMLRRYSDGTFIHWDVLNEVIEPKHGRGDGLRVSPFLEAFGPDYISQALILARQLAPNVRLYVNEYDLDYDTPVEKARRATLLRLVERLRKAEVPLDGIGIQAHLRIGSAPFSAPALRNFLRDLAGFNVRITITELDVRERDLTLPIETRDRVVADEFSRYLDVVLQEPAVEGVVTWGLSDRYSWRTTKAMREKGVVNRGLPFDESLSPKLAVAAIAATLERRSAP